MARRPFLLAASLASAFVLALVFALRATGDWRSASLVASVGAAEAAAGNGLLDQLMASFIPRSQAAADAALGTTPAPPPRDATPIPKAFATGEGSSGGGAKLPGGTALPCFGPECVLTGPAGSNAEVSAGSGEAAQQASGSAADKDEEEARLRLIKMKERTKGESRSYGGSAASLRRGGPPDAAALESSFGGFIQKLKGRAAAAAPAGTALGGAQRGSGPGAEAEGSDSPVLTRNGAIDPKYDSPTLRALQKVNKNSSHSFGMSQDPGLADGSKDHAGKNFDGNAATYGAVPIEEKSSSMGRRQITVAPEERPSR